MIPTRHTLRAPIVFSVMLSLACGATLWGSGMRIYVQDAAAFELGNAFTATADNPSAIYYNPAGITQLRGHNIRAGADVVSFTWEYRNDKGGSAETKGRLQGVGQIYYTYTPEQRPWSFGLGIYSPYGLGAEWPEDSPFRSVAKRAEMMFFSVNPVAAWKVSDRLSLGVGPMLNYAKLDNRRGLVAPGDEFRFVGDGLSPGFNAGLRWRVHAQHTLGLSYRSDTTPDLDGHASVRNLTPTIPGLPPSGTQRARLEVPFPQHVTVGWSYRPTPAWNLGLDVFWTDWDRLKTLTIRQASGSVPDVFNWRSTFDVSVGARRGFANGYSLGGGFMWGSSAMSDTHFNPAVTDLAGPCAFAGFGHQGKSWSWNVGYFAFFGLPRTVSGSTASPIGQSADGRYESQLHFLSVSTGARF